MTITERLDKYMRFKGLNPNKITVDAGLSVGLVGKSLKKNSGLNSDTIEKILQAYTDLNPEWFIIEKGEMLKTSNEIQIIDTGVQNYPPINYNRLPTVITIPENEKEKENIELVPVKLAAGYVGGGYAEESFVKKLPKFNIPFLKNGTFRGFGVGGHSMDRIQDNDWFIGRFLENLNDFNEGKVHAVIAPEAKSLLLKRVFRHPERLDMLILRSDSNDIVNTYPDIHINKKYISELWSYAALISFKEPAYDMMKFREILSTQPQYVLYD